MGNADLDVISQPWLHLVSSFLIMEPTESVISIARDCGGGSVTEVVQRFIWDHCISQAAEKGNAPYLKNFLKKLIVEVESNQGVVLDELYEHYTYIMTSLKDDHLVKGNLKVRKYVSFLFPDGCFDLSSCPKSRKLMVPLQCSLNMFEGDTGCSIWPSSLFLSEFILSFPGIFSNKSCFEVGSGAGLVGICLAHVKASKVTLTDGDLSTLANMRFNLELNQLSIATDVSERSIQDPKMVKCSYLPWEYASESEVRAFMPDIVLGADVIYNPSCLPHLVRVLSFLLNRRGSCSETQKESAKICQPNGKHADGKVSGAADSSQGKILSADDLDKPNSNGHGIDACKGAPDAGPREGPVAYIASVLRNIDTFNNFLSLAEQANLNISDVTETLRPFNLIPYMQSYERSSIRLFTVSCK